MCKGKGGRFWLLIGGSILSVCSPSFAGSHSWKIDEIFSNADGTIQFIELKECCGMSGERFIGGLLVTSQAQGTQFSFPGNLPTGSTAGKRMLLATDGYAALPGAIARDYAIPANFFAINGDTIRYNPQSNYDSFIFSAGNLPTDGVHSIQLTAFQPQDVWITAPANPVNYLDAQGQCVDNDGDGYGSPGNALCPNGAAADCDDNASSVHAGATELCSDGIDNDCDGDKDCRDSACNGAAACIPTISEWGAVMLVLLMMISGAIVLPRRGQQCAAR